jgi:hypothetical protein
MVCIPTLEHGNEKKQLIADSWWIGAMSYQLSAFTSGLSGLGTVNMEFLRDLWGYFKVRKKYWLLPVTLILLLFGALIVFTSGSAIAPFIYTIF